MIIIDKGDTSHEWEWAVLRDRLNYLIITAGGNDKTKIKYIDITTEYGETAGINLEYDPKNNIAIFAMRDILKPALDKEKAKE